MFSLSKRICKILVVCLFQILLLNPSFAQIDYGWIPVNEGLEGDLVAALWQSPSGTFFVGGIGGLFRSSGFQQPWEHTTLIGFDVGAFHATDDGRLFAGTREGLFVSSDDGISWGATSVSQKVYDIDSDDNGIVILGTEEGILKYTPLENLWESIGQWKTDTSCAANDSESVAPVCYVEISDNGRLWAAVGTHIYFSNDFTSWTCLERLNDGECREFPSLITSMQAVEDGLLISLLDGLHRFDSITKLVQPVPIYSEVYSYAASENALYIVTRSSSSANGPFPNALFRSVDNGITWTFEGQDDIGILSVIVAANEDWICLGEVEGVRCTDDSGTSWVKWNDGLANAKVLSVYGTENDAIIAGTIGGAFIYENASSTWRRLDINREAGDLKLPVDRINQSASGDIFTFGGGIHRSSDGGHTWERARFDVVFADKRSGLSNMSSGFRMAPSQWLPYEIGCPYLDAHQASSTSWGDTLAYVAGGNFVKSDDRWETANFYRSVGAFGDTDLRAIARTRQGHLIVGAEQDIVLRSLDEGQTWTRTNLSGIPGLAIQEFAILSGDSIVAATSDGLHTSIDAGQNWSRNLDINGCFNAIHATNSGVALAGGQYLTKDGGLSWDELPPPPAPVLSITFDAKGTPFIGTYGLGVFKGSHPLFTRIESASPDFQQTVEVYPNPVRDQVSIKLLVDNNQPVIVEVFDILGRKKKKLNYFAQRGENNIQANLSALPSGPHLLVIYTQKERLYSHVSLIH